MAQAPDVSVLVLQMVSHVVQVTGLGRLASTVSVQRLRSVDVKSKFRWLATIQATNGDFETALAATATRPFDIIFSPNAWIGIALQDRLTSKRSSPRRVEHIGLSASSRLI